MDARNIRQDELFLNQLKFSFRRISSIPIVDCGPRLRFLFLALAEFLRGPRAIFQPIKEAGDARAHLNSRL